MTSMSRTPDLFGFLKCLGRNLSTEKWRKYELLSVARDYNVVDGTVKAILKLGIVRKREPSGYFKNCTYLLGPAWEGNDVDTLLHKVEAEIPAFKAPRVLADAMPDSITPPEEPEYTQAMKEANREVFGASEPKEEESVSQDSASSEVNEDVVNVNLGGWLKSEKPMELDKAGIIKVPAEFVEESPKPKLDLNGAQRKYFQNPIELLDPDPGPYKAAENKVSDPIKAEEKSKATYSIFRKDGKDLCFIENGFAEASEAIDYVQDYIMENPNQVFVVVKTVAEFEAVVSVKKTIYE